jgi:hypothetical protein
VGACLLLPALPAAVRDRARERLLGLHARLARLAGERDVADAAGSDPSDDRVRLLDAEVARLRRALLEAGAVRELAEAGPRVRLIPAEAMPLGAGRELTHRVALGRGRQDGVLAGHPVLAGDALVGLVAAASEGTCEVRLVTDPSFRIRATLPRAAGDVEGMLQGDGTGLLSFQPALLDPTAPAPVPQVGETILSSRASLLCGVPAVLGVVVEVVRVPGSTAPQARVRPTVDLDRLSSVVIVRPHGDESDAELAGDAPKRAPL